MAGPRSGDVLLRPIEEGDWLAVHAWASQERVCRYQAWGPNTTEQTREFVREAAKAWTSSPRTRFVYAIALDEYVVGNCELKLHGQDQGEISYGMHPDYWGKGLATDAASQLVQLGFEEHNLHRVFATCDPRNIASAALLRRLGMSYEGRMRETMLIRDGWRDSDLYSVLAHEWQVRPDAEPANARPPAAGTAPMPLGTITPPVATAAWLPESPHRLVVSVREEQWNEELR